MPERELKKPAGVQMELTEVSPGTRRESGKYQCLLLSLAFPRIMSGLWYPLFLQRSVLLPRGKFKQTWISSNGPWQPKQLEQTTEISGKEQLWGEEVFG